MKIDSLTNDDQVLLEIGERLSRVRLDRNLTQGDLAARASVSKRTIERLEGGGVGTQLSGFIRVCRALDLMDRLNGLVPEPMPSPMAELKLRGKVRQRASGRHAGHGQESSIVREPGAWTWADDKP